MNTIPLHSTLLSARNMRVSLPGGTVVERLSFDLRRGEIATLIGGTAPGRLALLESLVGLAAPSVGRVWRDPRAVLGYAPRTLVQDPMLPMTVGRFVRLGARDAGGALNAVGLDDEARTLLADLPAEHLQKVALARAVARQADLLILEEPGSLGLEARADFFALIAALRDRLGCGVLLASHDLNIVMARSDHVICIESADPCRGAPVPAIATHAFRSILGPERAEHLAVYRHAAAHSGADIPQPLLGKAGSSAS